MTNHSTTETTPETNNPKVSEKEDVIPAVENWLRAHGYEWKSEVVFTNKRRADFIAKHTVTGETLIIEAKAKVVNADKVVRQVMDYAEYHGNPYAKLAIAIPRTEWRESLDLLCIKHGVELLLLEMPVISQEVVPAPVFAHETVQNPEQYDPVAVQLASKLLELKALSPVKYGMFVSFITMILEVKD